MQMLLCFLDSILAYHLNKVYNVNEKFTGLIFLIPCLIYTAGCPIYSTVFEKKKFDRRNLIMSAFFIASLGLILAGPSQLLKIPE